MGWRHLRLFGIPLHIDASWFIIVLLVAWALTRGYFPAHVPGLSGIVYLGMGITASLLLFACVLLHELGHSLVAKAYGIPVYRVTLFIFGGVAQIGSGPRRPWVELMVTLAGPLVSAAIAVTCFVAVTALTIHPGPPTTMVAGAGAPLHLVVRSILQYLAVINTGILLFNLLPGFPLDGGRLVHAALWAVTNNPRLATRMASWLGAAFGLGLMSLGIWGIVRGEWSSGIWYVLLGFFLRDAALQSYRQARPS